MILKYLLATSNYGEELEEDLNAIVVHNQQFNHAILTHASDEKNAGIMHNPNPLNLSLRFKKIWYSKSGYRKFIESS